MTDTGKTDVLVLGATGFTGGYIVSYLAAHPQRSHFSLALGGRSQKKLEQVAQRLNLSSDIKLVQVDSTNEKDIEEVIKGVRVVINAIGPYWLWGTPTVRACARNGVHYVDLTAEPHWLMNIIEEYDYLAGQTGAIIVPGCGYDSIPSDSSAYLSNKTLKSISSPNGEYLNAGTSTTVHNFRGGVSGGSISTAITAIEAVPGEILKAASKPYALSPVTGLARNPTGFQWLYKLAVPGGRPYIGAVFFMSFSNRQLVQRTFGLLELDATRRENKEANKRRYGPEFTYDEFMVSRSTFHALLFSSTFLVAVGLLLLKPFRALAKKFLPAAGEGPSSEEMERGFFTATNITSSTSSPPVYVKSVVKGKGDPGYLLTSMMISESALSILLPPASKSANATSSPGRNSNILSLPPLARQGGILTPMSAFGDVLVQRLEETGRFEFTSSVIGDEKSKKHD